MSGNGRLAIRIQMEMDDLERVVKMQTLVKHLTLDWNRLKTEMSAFVTYLEMLDVDV